MATTINYVKRITIFREGKERCMWHGKGLELGAAIKFCQRSPPFPVPKMSLNMIDITYTYQPFSNAESQMLNAVFACS